MLHLWLLPTALLVAAVLVSIPLSKFAAWIMEGQYRPLPRIRLDRAQTRQWSSRLEAVHGRTSDFQRVTVRLGLRGAGASADYAVESASARDVGADDDFQLRSRRS